MAETIGSPAAAGLRAALVRLHSRLLGGEAQWCPGAGTTVSTAATEDGHGWCPHGHTAPVVDAPMRRHRIIAEHAA